MLRGHGGDPYTLARRLGCAPEAIVDFSSNINPLGPPPGLLEYLVRRLERLCVLPEPDAGAALASFAARHDLDPATVVAGNGTTQLIHVLPRALGLRRAAVLGPTYADYADACRQHGTEVCWCMANADYGFVPSCAAIDEAMAGCQALFVCTPNNPTGVMLPRQLLLDLADAHPACTLVVDESYLPFVTGCEAHSLLGANRPNLVVLHSLSKIFRVPGLRIGFLIAPAETAGRIGELIPAWSVNSLAQEAVGFLMQQADAMHAFVRHSQHVLAQARRTFLEATAPIETLHPFPSATAFLLFKMTGGCDAAWLCEALADRRMLIRNCSNFHGLDHKFVRIALQASAADGHLAAALRSLLPCGSSKRPPPCGNT
jgi:threonine-phosphate decarboxylase